MNLAVLDVPLGWTKPWPNLAQKCKPISCFFIQTSILEHLTHDGSRLALDVPFAFGPIWGQSCRPGGCYHMIHECCPRDLGAPFGNTITLTHFWALIWGPFFTITYSGQMATLKCVGVAEVCSDSAQPAQWTWPRGSLSIFTCWISTDRWS